MKTFNEFLTVNEELAWFGPFQITDKMGEQELRNIYDAALNGYANWQKGFQYPKSDYKKAYQEAEKRLTKLGFKA